jgi:hypothetical protein
MYMRGEQSLALSTSTQIHPRAGSISGRVRLGPLHRRPEVIIEGHPVPSGICDGALPGSDTLAVGLVVDRLGASTTSGPLVKVRGWRVVVGPLPGREQLTVKDRLITCGIL